VERRLGDAAGDSEASQHLVQVAGQGDAVQEAVERVLVRLRDALRHQDVRHGTLAGVGAQRASYRRPLEAGRVPYYAQVACGEVARRRI
jgi:hypothetical protein